MIYILLLFFIPITGLLAQVSNFQIGDKWVYLKQEVLGSDTSSNYVIMEIVDIDDSYGRTFMRVNDYPNNVYWAETYYFNPGEASGENIFNLKMADLYDISDKDTVENTYYEESFVYNKTQQLFGTQIDYQHRRKKIINTEYGYAYEYQSMYSPEFGLIYFYNSYLDPKYTTTYYSLKAVSLDKRNFGVLDLLNLWSDSHYPSHRNFNKGDKWVYRKDRFDVTGTMKKTSYIIREWLDSTGTLLVKEVPGNKQWIEHWKIAPDSSSISLTAETFGWAGELKLYNKYNKDYYEYTASYSSYIYNKIDIFLNEMFDYQHRCFESHGPKTIPGQTQTIYSPEIGILFMRFYHSLNINETFYNDWNYLMSARIGEKVYGSKVLLDNVENAFRNERNFILEQNFPNPFNSRTEIRYQILLDGLVTLRVFNSLGEQVQVLVNKMQPAGEYNTFLDGSYLTSGVYFYQLQNGNSVQTKKLMILR